MASKTSAELLLFRDMAADPVAAGGVQRNGVDLKLYDGTLSSAAKLLTAHIKVLLPADSPYTILDDGPDTFYLHTDTGDITVNLPTIIDNIGRKFHFIKTHAANSAILDGEGGETIGGALTYTMTAYEERVHITDIALEWAIDVPKLDDLAAPDDNTDLDASASEHGLLPKLSNVVTEFLTGQGGWATPPGAPATKYVQRLTAAFDYSDGVGGYFVKGAWQVDALALGPDDDAIVPTNTIAVQLRIAVKDGVTDSSIFIRHSAGAGENDVWAITIEANKWAVYHKWVALDSADYKLDYYVDNVGWSDLLVTVIGYIVTV